MNNSDFDYESPEKIYSRYVDENSDVTWPDDLKTKIRLAQAIFGAWIVGKFDSRIDSFVDLITNPEPNNTFKSGSLYKRERYFRDMLKTLSDEQKQVVKQLVIETGFSVLFGAMVTLDQSRYGNYVISLAVNKDDENIENIPVAPDPSLIDLHDQLTDWVHGFSKYSDEIMNREKYEN